MGIHKSPSCYWTENENKSSQILILFLTQSVDEWLVWDGGVSWKSEHIDSHWSDEQSEQQGESENNIGRWSGHTGSRGMDKSAEHVTSTARCKSV